MENWNIETIVADMMILPTSKFPLLNNRYATLIWGISTEQLSVAEAKKQGLEILEEFNMPAMGANTACNVIWCNPRVYTHFKTYLVYRDTGLSPRSRLLIRLRKKPRKVKEFLQYAGKKDACAMYYDITKWVWHQWPPSKEVNKSWFNPIRTDIGLLSVSWKKGLTPP